MEDKFLSYEDAKKQPQTKQFITVYYMSDTKDIVIFRHNQFTDILIFKMPLTRDTYKESKRAWKNLCEVERNRNEMQQQGAALEK